MSGPDEVSPWVRDAEALVMSLRNVKGVSITTEGDDDEEYIVEINILADGQRPPKHILRDVRSALKAEFKLDVDYRKISIAQKRDDLPGRIPDEHVQGPYESPAGYPQALPDSTPGISNVIELVPVPEAGPRRVRFSGLTVTIKSFRAQVQVELALGDREAVGEAEGATGRQQVPRLIGEATLRAVEHFLADDYLLTLSDLEIVTLGTDTVVVVNVKLITDRRQQTLSGSSVVDHDLQQSMVYATLAALNRVLGRVQIKEPVEYELRPTSMSHSGEALRS